MAVLGILDGRGRGAQAAWDQGPYTTSGRLHLQRQAVL